MVTLAWNQDQKSLLCPLPASHLPRSLILNFLRCFPTSPIGVAGPRAQTAPAPTPISGPPLSPTCDVPLQHPAPPFSPVPSGPLPFLLTVGTLSPVLPLLVMGG